MRKVVCPAVGELAGLEVVDGDRVAPAAGEVVVAVDLAGVNFVDALICAGQYPSSVEVPFTPGTEVVGVVEAVGPGVDDTALGQRVLALPPIGGFATHIAVRGDLVVPLPDDVSSGQAAGLVQSYSTVFHALEQRAHAVKGEWVVVLGAGGGVGRAAVDVATALGCRVVACASTQQRLQLALDAGAEATIEYGVSDCDLRSAIREATAGGADIVVDPVGGDLSESALRALRSGGRFLVVGFASGEIPRIPLGQVLLNGRSVLGAQRDIDDDPAMARKLLKLCSQGRLSPMDPTIRPLHDVRNVLTDLLGRRVIGKVALSV